MRSRLSALMLATFVGAAPVALAESPEPFEELPFPLPAEPVAAPAVTSTRPVAFVALTGGVLLPQPFGRLGAAPTPELWGGWFVPVLDGRLAATLSIGYAQPSHERTVSDPRVPGGAYHSVITTRDLRLAPGLQFHFLAPSESLSPYAGARLRVHLVETTVEGDAGSSFGDARETVTQIGGAAFAGVLYRLGPGSLVGELELDVAPLKQTITGESSLSAIALRVGYALSF